MGRRVVQASYITKVTEARSLAREGRRTLDTATVGAPCQGGRRAEQEKEGEGRECEPVRHKKSLRATALLGRQAGVRLSGGEPHFNEDQLRRIRALAAAA